MALEISFIFWLSARKILGVAKDNRPLFFENNRLLFLLFFLLFFENFKGAKVVLEGRPLPPLRSRKPVLCYNVMSRTIRDLFSNQISSSKSEPFLGF